MATKFSDPVLCTRLKKRRRRFTGRDGEEEDFWSENIKFSSLSTISKVIAVCTSLTIKKIRQKLPLIFAFL